MREVLEDSIVGGRVWVLVREDGEDFWLPFSELDRD